MTWSYDAGGAGCQPQGPEDAGSVADDDGPADDDVAGDEAVAVVAAGADEDVPGAPRAGAPSLEQPAVTMTSVETTTATSRRTR